MFSSIFIGLSGMSAYSSGLRQVSNNITNLNTQGFKSSDVTFGDLARFGSTGLGSGDTSGGNGVSLNQPRIDFSQGELQQTDRDLDLSVDGDGFLMVTDGDDVFYLRTGSFEVAEDGYIVLAGTEYRLAIVNQEGEIEELSIESQRVSEPVATTTVSFADNLSSTADSATVSDITVYGATGETQTWQVRFEREADQPAGEWTVTVENADGEEVGIQTLTFADGVPDADSQELAFEDADEGISLVFDFSENVTSFSSGSVSTLRVSDVDGYGLGDITSLSVNDSGAIEAGYSNEQQSELGDVALVRFRESQKLEQRGNGLFAYADNQGRELYTSESSRVGRVVSGQLEASNVDLSDQFGELILVQRGYQASSQIVSVSNDMIQQLFGIRGQG